MPRPQKCRQIESNPEVICFKPAGIRMQDLDEIVLTIDEYEAVRLADYLGLYQEKAAEQMNVSRQTFGNIINSAHKKIAECLVKSKALKIAGGKVEISPNLKRWICPRCKSDFKAESAPDNAVECPVCKGGLTASGAEHKSVESCE